MSISCGSPGPPPCCRASQLSLAEKEAGGEAHFLALTAAPVLTIQLTAKELEAEGAAAVADDGHQPHVLHLQREVKQVDLQATVVHVTHKHLGGKQIGRMGKCGQSSFPALPHLPRQAWEAEMSSAEPAGVSSSSGHPQPSTQFSLLTPFLVIMGPGHKPLCCTQGHLSPTGCLCKLGKGTPFSRPFIILISPQAEVHKPKMSTSCMLLTY